MGKINNINQMIMLEMRDRKQKIMKELELLQVEVPNDFKFSDTFNHFQKVKNQVYVYVTPEWYGNWKVQAYERGTVEMCSLEAAIKWDTVKKSGISEKEMIEKHKENIVKLFKLADNWLDKYGDNAEKMKEDIFHPFHIKGWKGRDITLMNIYSGQKIDY
ncbi:hypothetical protein U8V72_21045 [Priestia filamentosa]|uniref:hypothetical protein n=1 Tax=Priestia filamentosa TaxID=1402861 RepID=UPI00397C426C